MHHKRSIGNKLNPFKNVKTRPNWRLDKHQAIKSLAVGMALFEGISCVSY